MTEPGPKRIWSSGFYNLDKLLLGDRVCEYHLGFFQLLSRNTGRLPSSLQCFSIPATKEPILSSLSLWLTLRLLHFVRPEKQPALCYQGKVHLFRVSSWDGFWASKSQSLFLTQLPAFLLFVFCFFSPVRNGISWESLKYCIYCKVQIEHL